MSCLTEAEFNIQIVKWMSGTWLSAMSKMRIRWKTLKSRLDILIDEDDRRYHTYSSCLVSDVWLLEVWLSLINVIQSPYTKTRNV